jgi:transcriptional/translational regulatory protein YebC/TACO1
MKCTRSTLLAADVNVDEIECQAGRLTIFAPPAEFYKAKTALLQAFPGTELDVQEITFLPQTSKTISPDDLPMFQKFLGLLHECDDVQDVYHNIDLPS